MESMPPKKKHKPSAAGQADYDEQSGCWKVTLTETGKTLVVLDLEEFQQKHGFVWVCGGTRLDSQGHQPEDEDGSYDVEYFFLRTMGEEEEEDEGEKETLVTSVFGRLDKPLLANIFLFTDLSDYASIARTCKLFHNAASSSLLVGRLVARATRPARVAQAEGRRAASKAKDTVARAKTIEYDVGVYRGKAVKNQAHGLGVYKANEGPEEYRGEWMMGMEHGKGCATYDDSGCYNGEFFQGGRHGFGVDHFVDHYGQQCRYEGRWKEDERSGLGLLLGGAYRFLVGLYKDGEPIGYHTAFDYKMKRVNHLNMESDE